MKVAKHFFTIAISFTLLILLSGCIKEPVLSNIADLKDSGIGFVQTTGNELISSTHEKPAPSAFSEPELAVSASVPSPFRIVHNNLIDLKNEMATRLSLSDYQVTSENADNDISRNNSIRENNIFAYHFHEVASLTEFYFVTVEIEGFELIELEISKYGVTYLFRCIETTGRGITISIRRPSNYSSPEEVWQVITEQALQHFSGSLSESGMIYHLNSMEILSRIGDTWFSIRVPNSLNNYEFLRDLAFDVIETSRPVVVEEEFFRRYLEAIISADDSMDVYYGSDDDVWVYWDIIPASVRITGEIEFSSADTNIVEVDSEGLITAVSIGQTTVTITVPTELGVLRAEVTVNVLAQP